MLKNGQILQTKNKNRKKKDHVLFWVYCTIRFQAKRGKRITEIEISLANKKSKGEKKSKGTTVFAMQNSTKTLE
jgi:hypothetical protein